MDENRDIRVVADGEGLLDVGINRGVYVDSLGPVDTELERASLPVTPDIVAGPLRTLS